MAEVSGGVDPTEYAVASGLMSRGQNQVLFRLEGSGTRKFRH